ncbi:lipopolysaccharide-induced tumor necrosis factor-alpha factor homolog [Teleopsis dalmanni]|uniref:lipopolysaccharide-induced tumor necrosis factor-alpha factor homolog n=1 Tax=Teleopsis dalmanni TaxID=139649 RepID=UPI0018CE76B6|nr:lipopolysaccharide-induced tumor necrosis factor-alpha factor homolog [Teleopsis dalmanni]
MSFSNNPYENLVENLNTTTSPVVNENNGAPNLHNFVTPNFTYTPTVKYLQPNGAVGPNSTEMNCPQCGAHIKTRVRHSATTKTHLMCLLLSCTCCCLLPYCMNSCQNTNHYCPNCNAFIGCYQ